VSRQQYFT